VSLSEELSKVGRPVPDSPLPVAERTGTNRIVYRLNRIETSGGTTFEIDHGLQKIGPLKGGEYPQTLTDAKDRGALGAVTLMVVDDRGEAVPNAVVNGGFWNHGKDGHGFEKLTDADGLVAVRDTCVGDLVFSIEKPGYYRTQLQYWFFKDGFDCVKDGRWIPWNPIIEVVLKRRVNPVAMCVRRGELDTLALPKLDEWTGFDLEHADWVSPHGKGKREDFQVLFQRGLTDDRGAFYQFTLTFCFKKPFDGVYLVKKDSVGSEMKTAYEADTNRMYETEITFSHDRVDDPVKMSVIVNDKLLAEDEYLVLRVRSETDREGRLSKTNYAKIYAPIYAAWYGFRMTTYFNPDPNNPSLEADTTKNLLNPHDLGFAP
jgi:hypothetical protein